MKESRNFVISIRIVTDETLYVYAQEDETQSAAMVARGLCNFLYIVESYPSASCIYMQLDALTMEKFIYIN